jgi:hypothetical protein
MKIQDTISNLIPTVLWLFLLFNLRKKHYIVIKKNKKIVMITYNSAPIKKY